MKITPLLGASALLNLGLAVWVVSLAGKSSPNSDSPSVTSPVTALPDSPTSSIARPAFGNSPTAPIPSAPSSARPDIPPIASIPASSPAFSFPRARSTPPNSAATPAAVPLADESPASGEAAPDPTLGRRQVVNSAAPGNSLQFRGVRVALAETYQAPGNGGRALGIDVSPATPSAAGAETSATPGTPTAGGRSASGATSGESPDATASHASDSPAAAGQPGAGTENSAPDNGGGDGFGFTREEELFRMKWGWAAFDAARAEARREAGRASQ